MPGTADTYHRHRLRPVLNSAAEIREWAAFGASVGQAFPCAVHIDSGMNRLGLAADEVEDVAGTNDLWSALRLSLVMSHLACADDPEHPKSEAQRQRSTGSARAYRKLLRASPTQRGSFSGPAISTTSCGPASRSMAGSPAGAARIHSRPWFGLKDASCKCAMSRRARRSATAPRARPRARAHRHDRGGLCRRLLPRAVRRRWHRGPRRVGRGPRGACAWPRIHGPDHRRCDQRARESLKARRVGGAIGPNSRRRSRRPRRHIDYEVLTASAAAPRRYVGG